jgi:hypothetical protein
MMTSVQSTSDAVPAAGQGAVIRQRVRTTGNHELEVQGVGAAQREKKCLERPRRTDDDGRCLRGEEQATGEDDNGEAPEHIGLQLSMQFADGDIVKKHADQPKIDQHDEAHCNGQADQVKAFEDGEGIAALGDGDAEPAVFEILGDRKQCRHVAWDQWLGAAAGLGRAWPKPPLFSWQIRSKWSPTGPLLGLFASGTS